MKQGAKCRKRDGLPDQYEENIPLFNGQSLVTNPYNCDTDIPGVNTYRESYFSSTLDKNMSILRIISHHFITVTGIIYNGDEIWLQISNFGEKAYINFSEYVDYASRFSDILNQSIHLSGNNILVIDNSFNRADTVYYIM